MFLFVCFVFVLLGWVFIIMHRDFALFVDAAVIFAMMCVGGRCLLQAQNELSEQLDHDGVPHLMSRLAVARGPPKTYLRVFADLRVFVPLLCLYVSVCLSSIGFLPTVALLCMLVLTCRLML